MTTPSESADLFVYDLDGVITRKDTFAALLASCSLRSPRTLARSLPGLLRWASAREQRRREHYSRVLTESVLLSMSEREYVALAARLGDRMAADSGWIRQEIVNRIAAQRASGASVVIATATERRLAECLLRGVGISYDLLSASELEATGRGMRFADHRVGIRKADALVQAGVDIERAEFITDSLADLPTARLAARVVLVGASKRTIAGFAASGVTTTVC